MSGGENTKSILVLAKNPKTLEEIERVGHRLEFFVYGVDSLEEFYSKLVDVTPQLLFVEVETHQVEKLHEDPNFNLLKTVSDIVGKTCPYFMISKNSESDMIKAALRVGASDCLVSPINTNYVTNKVKEFFAEYIDDVQRLPLQNVPDGKYNAKIDFKLSLVEISENSIVLKSKNFIFNKTNLVVSGALLDKITGRSKGIKVMTKDSWFDEQSGEYSYEAHFDEDDKELHAKVRAYLNAKIAREHIDEEDTETSDKAA